jgi:DNA processing protein
MTVPIAPDHDRHVASIALVARLGDGPRPLSPTKFWELLDRFDGDPTQAPDAEQEDIRTLATRQTSAALHITELKSQAITVLTPFHEEYPSRYLERLGRLAPPLLYAAGNLAVANQSDAISVGIVGSRGATESELAFAEELGRECAAHGFHTVSGGAKGVDAAGLNAAWTSGGFVLAVLAEGVRRAIRRRGLRQIIADEQGAILSAVHPDTGFSVGAAMGRNKLVYAASDLTVVAAVEEGEGGTWSGADEALRRGFGRVAVRRGARAETALIHRGALGIDAPSYIHELLRGSVVPDPETDTRDAAQGSLF